MTRLDKILLSVLLLVLLALSALWATAETTKIQFRRGPEAALPNAFANGEPAFTTDTHRLFIGYSTGKEEFLQRARFLGYSASQVQRLGDIWAELVTKAASSDPRFSDARQALAHYHNISTVQGLQQALDGKMPFQNMTAFARKRANATFANMTVKALYQKDGLYGLRAQIANGELKAEGGVQGIGVTARSFNGGPYVNLSPANDNRTYGRIEASSSLEIIAPVSMWFSAGSNTVTVANISGHLGSTANPHNTTAAQTGAEPALGNPSTSGWLLSSLNNGTRSWTKPLEACVDVFDGARGPSGPTVFCNISGGIRSVSYDANGLNPSGMTPFAVHLFEGSAAITPLYWSWYTGGASNRIYGSGTAASFTPSVKPIYSQMSSNNYVAVQIRYSTANGSGTCTAGTPVSVTKIGEKGVKGDQGATDFGSVQTALGTANDGTVTLLSATATEHVRIQVKNSGGYVVFGVTDRGLVTILNPAGYRLLSFDPTGSALTVKTSSGRTIFSLISSAAGAAVTF